MDEVVDVCTMTSMNHKIESLNRGGRSVVCRRGDQKIVSANDEKGKRLESLRASECVTGRTKYTALRYSHHVYT